MERSFCTVCVLVGTCCQTAFGMTVVEHGKGKALRDELPPGDPGLEAGFPKPGPGAQG